MEMPIQLIITLFIVLVVGTLVITFSQELIGSGKSSVLSFFAGDKKQPTGADLIDVTSISDDEVGSLVKECYKRNYGINLHSGICFTVHSQGGYSLSRAGIAAAMGDANVLGDVESASVKTFFINWNVDKGKVEVKT